jgi:hypothetical protein
MQQTQQQQQKPEQQKQQKQQACLTQYPTVAASAPLTVAEKAARYAEYERLQELVHKRKMLIPKPRQGRPSERISADQLKKAGQIIAWDIARQGKVSRWACPVHGKKSLSYDVSPDGVRVFCEICDWTTHSELTNFHPGFDDEDE